MAFGAVRGGIGGSELVILVVLGRVAGSLRGGIVGGRLVVVAVLGRIAGFG